MISAIERGAKAPTVVVLHRIATGLDTSLSRLVEEETDARVIDGESCPPSYQELNSNSCASRLARW